MTAEETLQEILIKVFVDRFSTPQEKPPTQETEESKIALEMIQSNTIFQLLTS